MYRRARARAEEERYQGGPKGAVCGRHFCWTDGKGRSFFLPPLNLESLASTTAPARSTPVLVPLRTLHGRRRQFLGINVSQALLRRQFKAKMKYLDRWIVLPTFMTMMCAIEKNGQTVQNALAKSIQTDPLATQQHVHLGFRYTCERWKLDEEECTKLTRQWKTFVVVRNPFERFVSAFKSKCSGKNDGDSQRHCWAIFGRNATLDSVADQLLAHESYNPHWDKQSEFCGGFDNYTSCISFRKIGALADLLNTTDEMLRRPTSETHMTHSTAAALSPGLKEKLRRIYNKDFAWIRRLCKRTRSSPINCCDSIF